MTRTALYLTAVALALLLAGCGIQFPSDPEGTMDRIRGGTLRVGVSPNPPWTDLQDGQDPGGREAELILRFAGKHGAAVEWTEGGEEALIGKLEHGELDVVIGGLTKKSPWSEKAALTRPYTEAPSAVTGDKEERVLASRMGENALLYELESFLLDGAEQP